MNTDRIDQEMLKPLAEDGYVVIATTLTEPDIQELLRLGEWCRKSQYKTTS